MRQGGGQDVGVAGGGQDDRAVDIRDGGDARVVGGGGASGGSVLASASGVEVVVVLRVAAPVAALLGESERGETAEEEDSAGVLHLGFVVWVLFERMS